MMTFTDEEIRKKQREGGRKGGKAKVPKGAAMLSPEERKAKARKAALARWSKREKTN